MVPVLVQELDDVSALESAMSLNCNRMAEDPLMLCFKAKRLVDAIAGDDKRAMPKAIHRCAVACNVTDAMARGYVNVAGMAPEAHEAFRSGDVTLSQLITLASLSAEAQKTAVGQLAASETHSMEETRAVRDQLQGKEEKPVKPSAKVIKDMLLLASFDAKDGVCSAQQLPKYIVEVLKWFVGEVDSGSVPGLQELQDRATSVEMREAKKASK